CFGTQTSRGSQSPSSSLMLLPLLRTGAVGARPRASTYLPSRSASLPDVGDTERLHPTVFLEAVGKIEGIVRAVLEDVEPAAEVDSPAIVGDDRSVVRLVVVGHLEDDASRRYGGGDLREEVLLL